MMLTAVAWPAATDGAWYAKFDGVDGTAKSVALGEQFDVLVGSDAEISPPGQSIGGYTFGLTYDATIVQSAVLDDLFDGASVSVVPTPAGAQFSASGVAASSLGEYARITFQALTKGTYILRLTNFDGFNTSVPQQPFPPQSINPASLAITVVPEPSALSLSMLVSSVVLLIRRPRNMQT